jgi:hypothetical protein
MQIIRRDDEQRVQVTFVNHFSVVAEDKGNVIFRSHFFRTVAINVTDSDNLHTWMTLEGRQVPHIQIPTCSGMFRLLLQQQSARLHSGFVPHPLRL